MTLNLTVQQTQELIAVLKARFDSNMHRHLGVEWTAVQARLEAMPEKLRMLNEMERTGGEPDVVVLKHAAGEYSFVDCSQESPAGRRSLCYDRAALDARKNNKPVGTAIEGAAAMGAHLLTEEQYQRLQGLDSFDLKTSSWLATPPEVRRLGGALFGDRRYNRVFVYHNGADSYYAVRGFRCILSI